MNLTITRGTNPRFQENSSSSGQERQQENQFNGELYDDTKQEDTKQQLDLLQRTERVLATLRKSQEGLIYECTPEQELVMREEAEFFVERYLKTLSPEKRTEVINAIVETSGTVSARPSPILVTAAKGMLGFSALSTIAILWPSLRELKNFITTKSNSDTKPVLNRRAFLTRTFAAAAIGGVTAKLNHELNEMLGPILLEDEIIAGTSNSGIIFNMQDISKLGAGPSFRRIYAHELCHLFGGTDQPNMKDSQFGCIRADSVLADGYGMLRVMAKYGDAREFIRKDFDTVLRNTSALNDFERGESFSRPNMSMKEVASVEENILLNVREVWREGEFDLFAQKTDHSDNAAALYRYGATTAGFAWARSGQSINEALRYMDTLGTVKSLTITDLMRNR